MRRFSGAVLALSLLASTSAHAAQTLAAAPAAPPVGHSDLVSFSIGYLDFDKTEPKRQSVDYRLEYRFGVDILPFASHEVQLHPFVGGEITSRDMTYGLGGLALDWEFTQHGILTWSEGAGYLDSGNMNSMGGTFQFRSQLEAGYRFDNDMRVTGAFSHISDAKLTRTNPGAEILGVYLHVPVRMFIGG